MNQNSGEGNNHSLMTNIHLSAEMTKNTRACSFNRISTELPLMNLILHAFPSNFISPESLNIRFKFLFISFQLARKVKSKNGSNIENFSFLTGLSIATPYFSWPLPSFSGHSMRDKWENYFLSFWAPIIYNTVSPSTWRRVKITLENNFFIVQKRLGPLHYFK